MDARTRSEGAAILAGGLIAGTIDIGSAAVINLVSPFLILQAIASGILGRASFFDGVASAMLGLLLQWAMSIIIAAVYVFACRLLPRFRRNWIASGFGYGVVIFFVMNYIVVPLSAARPHHGFPNFTALKFTENMLAMLLFGLIVAWFAQRLVRAAAPPFSTVEAARTA